MIILLIAQLTICAQEKNPSTMSAAEMRRLEIEPCIDKAVKILSTRNGQVAFCSYTEWASHGKEPYLHWGAIGSSWLWHLLFTSPQSASASPKFILREFVKLSMAYAKFTYVPPNLKPFGHNIVCETLYAVSVGNELFLAYASKHANFFNVSFAHRESRVIRKLLTRELESEAKKSETSQEAAKSFAGSMRSLRESLTVVRRDVVRRP